MKISTADCVNYLIQHTVSETAKEWKRRSKVKHERLISRVFENTTTKELWAVTENDGVIIDCRLYNEDEYMDYIFDFKKAELEAFVDKKGPARIYYVINQNDMGSYGLSVTDADYFDKEKCMSDWTPKGTFQELDRLGYPGGEAMEAEVEFMAEVIDLNDLKAKLSSSNIFQFSPEFYKFMKRNNSEEFKVVPI